MPDDAPTERPDRPLALARATDPETLRTLIELHAPLRTPMFPLNILDVTYADGKMWRGLDYEVTTLDINPAVDVDYHGDFRDLRHVTSRDGRAGSIRDRSVDVLVFDPPHRSESGARSVYAERFGLRNRELAHVPDISFYFRPFLAEARRVLRRDGVLLAKIADQVHRNRRRWQPFVFWREAAATPGLTPCDFRPQERSSNGFEYEGRVMHLTQNYACWFVIRRGRRCTRDS